MVEGSNRRIHTVDRHAGLARAREQAPHAHAHAHASAPVSCAVPRRSFRVSLTRHARRPQAVAGLAPDGRVLVTRARGEAAQYIRRAHGLHTRAVPTRVAQIRVLQRLNTLLRAL